MTNRTAQFNETHDELNLLREGLKGLFEVNAIILDNFDKLLDNFDMLKERVEKMEKIKDGR